jgi:methyl-accepting chemotaxis protein/hemerythrin
MFDERFDVKIKLFNDQHQALIATFYKLFYVLYQQDPGNSVNQVMGELEDYAFHHFQEEENLFSKYGYPESEEHVAEHDEFRKKIAELSEKIKENRQKASVELLGYLKDWVENHVEGTDKKYSEFFNSKGVF